ncbi:MAG: hypothetical protein EA387_03835 [Nitriliruptor sp.]|nr:MAG: hypothetical protein EA387_03835 [Nitriliruptor sp.]
MTASERERHELAAKLEELLGPDQAATLMEHLPPMRWDALARQDDLLALRSDVDGLRHDVDGLRHDVDGLRHDVDGLRHDVDGLRHDVDGLRGDVDGLRGDVDGLRHGVDGLRGDVDGFKGELHDLRTEMTRTNDRIDHLTEVMELRFESLGDRITAHVAERVDSQTKLLVFSLLGAVLTAAAIALGANAL